MKPERNAVRGSRIVAGAIMTNFSFSPRDGLEQRSRRVHSGRMRAEILRFVLCAVRGGLGRCAAGDTITSASIPTKRIITTPSGSISRLGGFSSGDLAFRKPRKTLKQWLIRALLS